MISSIWDWIVVLAVVLILFGATGKIPELFRALGRAVGEFRKGQMEVEREIRQMMQEPQHANTLTQSNAQTTQPNNAQAGQVAGQKRPIDEEYLDRLIRQIDEIRMELERIKAERSRQS